MIQEQTNCNSNDSKVTIDDLAIMIAKGFKETDDLAVTVSGLAVTVANGFKGMDSLVIKVDKGFKEIKKEISGIKENMATKDDIERLEVKFDSLEKVVFKDHAPRLRRIESKLQIA